MAEPEIIIVNENWLDKKMLEIALDYVNRSHETIETYEETLLRLITRTESRDLPKAMIIDLNTKPPKDSMYIQHPAGHWLCSEIRKECDLHFPIIGLISPEITWGDAHSSLLGCGANKALETGKLYLELRKDPKYLGNLIDEILERC